MGNAATSNYNTTKKESIDQEITYAEFLRTMEVSAKPSQLTSLFISSSDSLRASRIPQELSPGWNDKPPLFNLQEDETEQLIMEMNRKGVPPALRCAVWISSVVRSTHPDQPDAFSQEYRTLLKAMPLDRMWDVTKKEVLPDESDDVVTDNDIPQFGMGDENLQLLLYFNHGGTPIPELGKLSLMRVLRVAEHVLGIDYCPLMPSIVAILLNYMTESYSFATLRAMSLDTPYFFSTTVREHYGWCSAFADILRRLHPQTASTMEVIGALTPEGLDPIFKHFFTPILKYDHVMRLMDIYCYEGAKALFRFGVALLCLCKRQLKQQAYTSIKSSADWWRAVRSYTHSPAFRFDYLVKKAYGFHGSGVRRKVRFPRRDVIYKIIKMEQDRLDEGDISDSAFKEMAKLEKPRPLGLHAGPVPIELGKPSIVRACLAEWLPVSLQLTKLDLIYSSDKHGRTLERFYYHARQYKHTITLMEVIGDGSIIGMYASQAWRQSPTTYGDGECFLFRVSPNPVVYKWKPGQLHPLAVGDEAHHEGDYSTQEAEHLRSLVEQFMSGRANFLGMGGGEGCCGLGLNEDMTRGSSGRTEGFQNDPLPGDGATEFEVGLIEVYRLVRQMDGKGVEETGSWGIAMSDNTTDTASMSADI